MSLSIHHIAINAQVPAAIAALYAKAVGFSAVEAPGPATWVAAQTGFIALHPTDAPATAHPLCDPGIGHFCIQSGDGERMWERLTEAGIAFNARPTGLGTGVMYSYGRDGECNLIETEGVSNEAPETPPWMAHVALVSSDLDRLAEFYARLIGRAPHREGDFANPAFKQVTGYDDVRVSAKWIMADNMIFEMWRYHNPPTEGVRVAEADAPGYRHVGFSCGDLEAERARLSANGVALEDGETVGGMPSLAGTDPDGNRFVIVEANSGTHPLALSALAAPGRVSSRLQALL